MERGLDGMCAGETRRVIIPPSWGYGEKGSSSGKVPGSAVLIFDVQLQDFHNPNDVSRVKNMSEEPEGCEKIKVSLNTVVYFKRFFWFLYNH